MSDQSPARGPSPSPGKATAYAGEVGIPSAGGSAVAEQGAAAAPDESHPSSDEANGTNTDAALSDSEVPEGADDYVRAEMKRAFKARDIEKAKRIEAEQLVEAKNARIVELETRLSTFIEAAAKQRHDRMANQLAKHLSLPASKVAGYVKAAEAAGVVDAGVDLDAWARDSLPLPKGLGEAASSQWLRSLKSDAVALPPKPL